LRQLATEGASVKLEVLANWILKIEAEQRQADPSS
jgi:hypothetical protein